MRCRIPNMRDKQENVLDLKTRNAHGRELWNRKAKFWDDLHGDQGNQFHRRLVEPSVLQLLQPRAGETILDIGCGNGALARRLAAVGANVMAVDFSDELIALARGRGDANDPALTYRVCDATDDAALLALGERQYDAITSCMMLMDIPTTEPLFRAASKLLRASGRFVFATMHPAFNSNNPIFLREKEDRDGVVIEHYAIKLREYLAAPPVLGAGAPGEPTPHYYYHRPLSQLLSAAFAAGFVLDGLLEPAFLPQDAAESAGLAWQNFHQFPPILSGRLRLA